MTTITKTVEMYLYARKVWSVESKSETKYEWVACSMERMANYIFVAKKEFNLSVDVPADFDLNQTEINGLHEVKEKIQAETHLKIQNIDDQIQRLLAIGHDS